jgi:hypothetical protein
MAVGPFVADRSFVARLRAAGGPSHDLLVLLDQHRALTTGQLARATDTPERTTRYRVERLHRAGLVECARPGRERGSAPRHWWLRTAGARLVTGTAAAEGRPSGMFVAHAAAISEVWLALVEHGRADGIEVVDWLTDRAGWQEWERSGRWSAHSYRLTPDAVATLRLGGRTVVVFVEVDLASTTQTLLRQKAARYAAYAADRAWEGRHPHCPPMLLLTTTATRAATFTRVAGRVLDGEKAAVDVNDPAASLVVAACGYVRQPERAVAEPCWTPTEPGAAELTLAEVLAERVEAQAASAAWWFEQDTIVRRRDTLDALRSVASFTTLAHWLDSDRAAEALRHIIGAEPAVFLDREPELAEQVVEWFARRRRIGLFQARDLARPLVALLQDRHTALWREQAARLLAADEHIAAEHPRMHRLAATLAAGSLLSPDEMAYLDTRPAQTRGQIQAAVLAAYAARRAAAVERDWAARSWRERRRTTRERLATAFDAEHLAACDTCGLAYPDNGAAETLASRCRYCEGSLIDNSQAARHVPLADRLDLVRDLVNQRPATISTVLAS